MSREYPCIYYDNQKCTLHSEPGYTDWCVMGPCSRETPSNADHIRSMTDEELAKFLLNGNAPEVCPNGCDECNGDCDGRMLDWLKQPYKDGD